VSHHHAAAEQLGELLEHLARGRRGVDHGLGDAGEALDAARERAFRPDQRVECVVQLASTDEHRPDLGQLAEVGGKPVRLGVDGEKLGARHGLVEQIHERPMQARGPDGSADELQHPRDADCVGRSARVR
jgi:hypothetical protein